ncbi:lipoyl synthase [Spirochaeta isovalerica]|uniref:Lipoyl synthase n=1 Tax=Spirochaeta isovalerica TaxID=150 RepID=A0A841RDU4_9SPIO|nr:lipoyl synthase [Spirochaeta isovalerica]MBB6481019.1 lipoic acid synthetase [Spirochaeta isovalerica]
MEKPLRKPEWLRVRLNTTTQYKDVRKALGGGKLNTVCTEANCPNQHECWGKYKTATFMILGEICTRGCRFCSVTTGKPGPVSEAEPLEVAEAVRDLDLKHAVITMVTRDDLDDGGAAVLAETVREIRRINPVCSIEILSSDLRGKEENIKVLCNSKPEVVSHNIETVRRLKKEICSGATYENSIQVLKMMKDNSPDSVVKSSLMIGLGETREEILETMDDLLEAGVSILNIGQYLQPTRKNAAVIKYWTPEEFEELRERALEKGFTFCESGPLVRSSYHAGKHFDLYKKIISQKVQ